MRAATAALAALCLLVGCNRTSRIEQAVAAMEDSAKFSTGLESGQTMARVASLLRKDADRCADDHRASDPRCSARFSAAAYAQVLAVAVLDCTVPDRTEARQAMARYLRAVDRVTAKDRIPSPPPTPRCT